MRGEDVDPRLGDATLLPDEPVPAGARRAWSIVFTVGERPLGVGSSLRFDIPLGFSSPQLDYPSHVPGYVWVTTSPTEVRPKVSLHRPFPAPDPRAVLRAERSVYVRLTRGALAPGHQLTLHYGRLDAWPGVGALAQPFSGVASFTVAVDCDGTHAGRYTGYTLVGPPLRVHVRGGPPQRALLLIDSQIKGAPVRDAPPVTLLALDRYENPAESGALLIGVERTAIEPQVWDVNALGARLTLGGASAIPTWHASSSGDAWRAQLCVDCLPGETLVDARSGPAGLQLPENAPAPTGRIQVVGNPGLEARGAAAPYQNYRLCWGDLHTHTALADGRGSPDDLCAFARDRALLDFVAVHDHVDDLEDADWARLCDAAARHHAPRRFVTLLGYEYSPDWPRSYAHGDKNVFFPGDNGVLFPAIRGPRVYENAPCNLGEVAAALKEAGALMMAHAHARNIASFYDPDLLRLLEVYSDWGNAERLETVAAARPLITALYRDYSGHYVQDALARGFRAGLVAGSDDHSGHPGLSTWQPRIRWYPGGLAAVYARSLTRADVWDALWARRCYGTTGARLVVEFAIDATPMGGERHIGPETSSVRIAGRVLGTGPLAQLTIVRNGQDWHQWTYPQHEERWDVAFALDESVTNHAAGGHCYYLRAVQHDGERAWTSPVWVDRAVDRAPQASRP